MQLAAYLAWVALLFFLNIHAVAAGDNGEGLEKPASSHKTSNVGFYRAVASEMARLPEWFDTDFHKVVVGLCIEAAKKHGRILAEKDILRSSRDELQVLLGVRHLSLAPLNKVALDNEFASHILREYGTRVDKRLLWLAMSCGPLNLVHAAIKIYGDGCYIFCDNGDINARLLTPNMIFTPYWTDDLFIEPPARSRR